MALIGAKTTAVTRYIEYMDGSIMADGKFADSVATPLGDVHFGKGNADCVFVSFSVNCCMNRWNVISSGQKWNSYLNNYLKSDHRIPCP